MFLAAIERVNWSKEKCVAFVDGVVIGIARSGGDDILQRIAYKCCK